MQKNIFFIAAIVFLLVSCSTSKNLTLPSDIFGNDYTDSPDNYFHDKSYVPPAAADSMIKKFRRFKYRTSGKIKMINAWSSFDKALVKKIYDDPNVDSVKFFFAAITKKGPYYKLPFILMQVSLTVEDNGNSTGKGGNETRLPVLQMTQYFSPVNMCPPPTNDCRL